MRARKQYAIHVPRCMTTMHTVSSPSRRAHWAQRSKRLPLGDEAHHAMFRKLPRFAARGDAPLQYVELRKPVPRALDASRLQTRRRNCCACIVSRVHRSIRFRIEAPGFPCFPRISTRCSNAMKRTSICTRSIRCASSVRTSGLYRRRCCGCSSNTSRFHRRFRLPRTAFQRAAPESAGDAVATRSARRRWLSRRAPWPRRLPRRAQSAHEKTTCRYVDASMFIDSITVALHANSIDLTSGVDHDDRVVSSALRFA